ncbi:dynein heavy chain and region D6 of dynein motor-domain-containing protein [Dunaliella salina]|uniref:Dynein heavy chain and region D6 of dynein motor-domain-containing protein n=1 Tax=Dunaliella salina TaxID=3046 RepID=A0ABQ7H2T7_DUNSA|nr:dynein heavy chain and region D6 of dynein motor-domain-containing protein [Dunaliella salina]|eukprot:KAF5841174.1 dynein heavy chain and region D6 of dynein motor-domain-containing protein [Dunaliella salina]
MADTIDLVCMPTPLPSLLSCSCRPMIDLVCMPNPLLSLSALQLSSNEVPTQWLDAVPGLALNAEGIGTWVSDLQERLAFIYRWACEGPPVVVPLGMLAKPKAYLTSMQQIHAEKQNVAVGSLTLRCCILDQPDSMSTKAMHMSPEEMQEVEVCTNEGGNLSLLQCWQFGCLVNGVTLQGAQWDGDECCLTEPAPTHIFCPMPLLWLVPLRERQSAKGSHWRMLNKTVNLQDELEGLGGVDIEGLVTGRSSNPPRGRQDRRVRRMATVGGQGGQFEAKLRDERLRAKSKSPRRFSVVGEVEEEESPAPAEGDAEEGKGQVEPLKPLADSALMDLWGLDQGAKQQERYDCPVYLHTHSFGGRVSNRGIDVEDCLFDLKLPTGKHSPMHWITRNVVMLVAPYSLRE